MITRIEIDGFKSLRDFAIDLDPFTVLIGPNSAGKSNVLEALALLSRLASMRIEDAFKQGRGKAIDQFTRQAGEAAAAIRFAVEVFVPKRETGRIQGDDIPNRYRYELVIERRRMTSGTERLVVKAERLSAIEHADDLWLQARPRFTGAATHSAVSDELFAFVETDEMGYYYTGSLSGQTRFTTGPSQSIGLQLFDFLQRRNAAQIEKHARNAQSLGRNARGIERNATDAESAGGGGNGATMVADELRTYGMLHLDAIRLREPSERIGSDSLTPDASNLPTVLANLSTPILGAIRADMAALVPGISTFDIVPDDDSLRIDFELSDSERLPARLVSDGTLRILALLTALRVEPQPSAIGIEEPENGVYPGRLRKLIDYLQEIAAQRDDEGAVPAQIILTTHSPVVLAALRSRPEHLRFISLVRRNGKFVTHARTVGTPIGPGGARSTASLREVDELLHAADSEIGR